MRSSLILLAVLLVLSSCTAPQETQTKGVVPFHELPFHKQAWLESITLLDISKKKILNPGVENSVAKAIEHDYQQCELLADTRQAKEFCRYFKLTMLVELSKAERHASTSKK